LHGQAAVRGQASILAHESAIIKSSHMTVGMNAFVFLLSIAWPASAQLPASATLSAADTGLFHAEIARIEKLLTSAADKGAVTYQMARTWASAKQWPETITWLRRVAAFEAGLDPSRDPVFKDLHGTREFAEILEAVRRATGPVSNSRFAFRIKEGDLIPESVAYDPRDKRFYFGSTQKGKIVRCTASGSCAPFATGLGVVLGLKVYGGGLWFLSNSGQESALMHHELASAREIRKYAIAGAGHNFNDLVITRGGGIYLTDTPAAALWYLADGAASLVKLPGRFEAANGIALSSDGALLYVSTYPDGLAIVDLKTGVTTALARPVNLCLAAIDGLYFHRGTLIAIQNGFMTPRVVRLILTRDLRRVARFEVLERRNPLFEGVTTGIIVGDEFFYMANIQDDKKTGFDPISILKIHL
jgi:sugar lactone lactonase YvrE